MSSTFTQKIGVTVANPYRIYSSGGDFTATTDYDVIIFTTANSIGTLYTAVGNAGNRVKFDNKSTGDITCNCYGSETIQGETTQILHTNNLYAFWSDGTNWRLE